MQKVIALVLLSFLLLGCVSQQPSQQISAQPEAGGEQVDVSPQPAADNGPAPAPEEQEETQGSETQPPQTGSAADTQTGAPSMEFTDIDMTARQWSFEPATVRVRVGDKVRLRITSVDVAHGFALSDFGINARLEPGQTTEIVFLADRPGTFGFFCSVFCGSGHGGMRGELVVEE